MYGQLGHGGFALQRNFVCGGVMSWPILQVAQHLLLSSPLKGKSLMPACHL